MGLNPRRDATNLHRPDSLPLMPHARTSRRYKRTAFLLWTALSLMFAVASGLAAHQRLTGGEATGVVIDVRNGLHATVKFVTEDGRLCEATLDSPKPYFAVGDEVEIGYEQACRNIWRQGERSWILYVIGSLIFLGVGAIGTYIAWFRTDPDGRIRWWTPARR
jgi:hypothetical protein